MGYFGATTEDEFSNKAQNNSYLFKELKSAHVSLIFKKIAAKPDTF